MTVPSGGSSGKAAKWRERRVMERVSGNSGSVVVISKSSARRYLLKRLGFSAESPWRSELRGSGGTLIALRRLENIQIDPVNVIARNQALAVAQRVEEPGEGLDGLLTQGKVFEYTCSARFAYPIEDYPYFRFRMREMATHWAERLKGLESAVQTVLKRLEREGPLPSRALDSHERVQGFWDSAPATKATRHALDLLEDAGMVTTVRREGQERYFALPELVYPKELFEAAQAVSASDWRDFIVAKYFRGHVLAHASDFRFGWIRVRAEARRCLLADWTAAGRLRPVRIEGVRRLYYALADDCDGLLATATVAERGETEGPVFIIPPLDNLLFLRDRLLDLFDFAYTWEVYVPPAKRRYGPYTMPLLAGERLIGRLDARLDRETRTLAINILEFEPWLEPGWGVKRAVRLAVEQLGREVGAATISVADPARVHVRFD